MGCRITRCHVVLSPPCINLSPVSALGPPDQEGNPGDDGGPAAAADLTPRPRGVDESIVTTCDLCVTISAAIKPRPTLPSIHSVIKTKSVDFN